MRYFGDSLHYIYESLKNREWSAKNAWACKLGSHMAWIKLQDTKERNFRMKMFFFLLWIMTSEGKNRRACFFWDFLVQHVLLLMVLWNEDIFRLRWRSIFAPENLLHFCVKRFSGDAIIHFLVDEFLLIFLPKTQTFNFLASNTYFGIWKFICLVINISIT